MKSIHLVIVCLLCCFFGLWNVSSTVAQEETEARLFELRVYTTHEGKLDDLNRRFREHTNRLFKKHGMELIGFWTPQETDNQLVYILAYPNLKAREDSWKGFLEDPEWKAAYIESKADGPLVKSVESQYMSPTDYSPIR